METPHEIAAVHIVEVIKAITADIYPDEVITTEDIHSLLRQYNKDVEQGFKNSITTFTKIFQPDA